MKNAIERRIQKIDELWDTIAREDGVRLIRWMPAPSDLQLVEVHLRLQIEDTGSTPDLFLKLDTPFAGADTAAGALADAIVRACEEARDETESMGFSRAWEWTARDRALAGGPRFLAACRSVIHAYGERFRLLVLWLAPSEVPDPAAWAKFLARMAAADLPPRLRIVVLDNADAPLLAGLDDSLPGVRVVEPALDMNAAMEELVRSEGNPGPGKDFRIAFVGIGTAASRGNMSAARRSARTARAVAQKEGWTDQEIAAYLAFASALVGAKRFRDAAKVCTEAFALAESPRGSSHPMVPTLKPIIRLTEGAALVAAEAHEEAAEAFRAAGELAEEIEDPLKALEAWRMAGYCHECEGRKSPAWRACSRALAAGEALPPGQRAATTLPFVGEAMLRLLAGHQNEAREKQTVHARMIALLGAAWDPEGAAAARSA